MEKLRKVSVLVTKALWDRVNAVASAEGLSRQSLIRSTLIKRVGLPDEPVAAPPAVVQVARPRLDVNAGPNQPAAIQLFGPKPAPAPKVETTDEKEYRMYMQYVGVCKTMGYPVKLFEEFQATINSVDTNDEDDSIDL